MGISEVTWVIYPLMHSQLDRSLLKAVNCFAEIAISLQIRELWPKIGIWQVSDSKPKPSRNGDFTAVIEPNRKFKS